MAGSIAKPPQDDENKVASCGALLGGAWHNKAEAPKDFEQFGDEVVIAENSPSSEVNLNAFKD
jgi:hypothetical protein